MPFGVVVSSPAPTAATSNLVVVPRSADLVIRFDGGTPGVLVQLEADDGAGSVRCAVDSLVGELTVPASVLAALPPGAPLQVTTVAEASVSPDGYDVTLRTAVGVHDREHAWLDFELE